MKVRIVDDLHPEDLAMVQALYSRSSASVEEHLAKVARVGSCKFMQQYYVNYGHASIGDCGSTTVFLEGVSTLVAKAVQDWPLYSGQEASTRYMDFSAAAYDDPAGTPVSKAIQERWLALYARARPIVHKHLAATLPRRGDGVAYDRALVARTFDVCRSLLPAGVRTNLSWTTNLRQAADKLRWLGAHPLRAARLAGCEVEDALRVRYPHSFPAALPEDREAWREAASTRYYVDSLPGELRVDQLAAALDADVGLLREALPALRSRPRGAEMPPWMAEVGVARTAFLLDYGSFRDLQRHRAGTVRASLLTTARGFHPWYLEQMPTAFRGEVEESLSEQELAIDRLGLPLEDFQNYVAMGYLVQCRVTQALPYLVYRLELRTRKTVHPTLRQVAQREARWLVAELRALLDEDLPLHVDLDEDDWDVRRGAQTIERRDAGGAP